VLSPICIFSCTYMSEGGSETAVKAIWLGTVAEVQSGLCNSFETEQIGNNKTTTRRKHGQCPLPLPRPRQCPYIKLASLSKHAHARTLERAQTQTRTRTPAHAQAHTQSTRTRPGHRHTHLQPTSCVPRRKYTQNGGRRRKTNVRWGDCGEKFVIRGFEERCKPSAGYRRSPVCAKS
jgi:hypothetical protein